MKFNSIIDTDKGAFKLEADLNEEQIRYLVELGMSYLITIGVVALPDKVRVPTKEEQEKLAEIGEDYKRHLN